MVFTQRPNKDHLDPDRGYILILATLVHTTVPLTGLFYCFFPNSTVHHKNKNSTIVSLMTTTSPTARPPCV